MRCVISLTPDPEFQKTEVKINLNYNHSLLAVILSFIKEIEPSLAEKLHSSTGFKFYTFSRLFAKNGKIINSYLVLPPENSYVKFYVSSPDEKIIKTLMKGAVSLLQVKLGNGIFYPSFMSILEDVEITQQEKMKLLSPLVLSKPVEKNGKLFHKYLSPFDKEFFQRFSENLKRKYEVFYGSPPKGEVKVIPDWDYINKKKKISKLVKIKDSFIRGYLFPFLIEGDRELIKFGYNAGFGEKTGMGFGFAEVIR